ncbi:response regulator [bacterium]|nr:response regulator [bacterium]
MTDILLVEDSPDDILITQKALKQAKVVNKVWVVEDGQEALDFLYHKGKYQNIDTSPEPGLILLDINLPEINGLELLKRLKGDADLKRIPTVIFTVSGKDENVVTSYNHGCNSFIQKPVKFEKFIETVKQISLYWGLLNIPSPNGLE